MHIIKIGYNERNKGVSEDTVLCKAVRKGDADSLMICDKVKCNI